MIHWNADPVLLSYSFGVIHWYGLFFATAFLLGYRVMWYLYNMEGLSSRNLERVFIYMFAGTLIGARLGHCLFYNPHYYLAFPLDVFKVWEGGLASHGGALGVLCALYLYTLKQGTPKFLWLLDRIVISSALGGAMIRLGNFMNSEIVGMPTKRSWGVVFERMDMIPRHPVQLYESAAYFVIFGVLLTVYHRNRYSRSGLLTGLFLVLVFSARFFLEFLKLHQALFTPVFNVRVGQMLSLPFILMGVFFIIRSRKNYF